MDFKYSLKHIPKTSLLLFINTLTCRLYGEMCLIAWSTYNSCRGMLRCTSYSQKREHAIRHKSVRSSLSASEL